MGNSVQWRAAAITETQTDGGKEASQDRLRERKFEKTRQFQISPQYSSKQRNLASHVKFGFCVC